MNLQIKIQILHHAFDQEYLLVILFAKVGVVTARNQEQLGHYREHATEMARTVRATIQALQGLIANKRQRVTIRIHLLHARGEHIVGSERTGELGIRFQALRVLVQILVLAELDRIQEHAHHRDIAVLDGFLDKGPMAIVQGPHRGNKPDNLAFLRKRFEDLTQGINSRYDLHYLPSGTK